MIIDRSDIFRRLKSTEPVSAVTIKHAERAALQSDIDAFIANGGRISEVPAGVSGDSRSRGTPIALATGDSDESMLERNRRAAKHARAVQRQSSELFISGAAEYLGMKTGELEKLIAGGNGPKYDMRGRGNARKRFKMTDLDAYKRSRA